MSRRTGAATHSRGSRGTRARRSDGAAAVEFAMVFPIFIALVMGIIQYGWYFYAANSATAAAREGARRIVVGDCWDSAFLPFVQSQAPVITGASHLPVDLTPVPVGDAISVTVTADSNLIEFLPMPASMDQVSRTFTARMEDKTAGTCA